MSRAARPAAPKPARRLAWWWALLVLILLLIGQFLYFATQPLSLATPPIHVHIRSGQSLKQIANHLTEQGVLPEPWRFMLLAKLLGKSNQLQAGEYTLDQDPTPIELLTALSKGTFQPGKITFPEGWRVSQMRDALARHPDLVHDTVDLSEADIAARLQLPTTQLEGLFFPDTYHFNKGSAELSVLKLAATRMEDQLAKAWAKRAPDLPLKTPYEALILASIIEKETGVPADRHNIGAVFINRLRQGMRLQTDPTVIYGLGEGFDGNLTRAHLAKDGPYNSYTRVGLPPTPIALPGRAALDATLHPAKIRALYFVAKGDGSGLSRFSETLAQHNRAVALYLREQKSR